MEPQSLYGVLGSIGRKMIIPLCLAVLLVLVGTGPTEAAPHDFQQDYLNDAYEVEEQIYLSNLLAKLNAILKNSQKRGIDFGLGRGYSGSQAARHMMGMQQASFAGGPGKRSDPRSFETLLQNKH